LVLAISLPALAVDNSRTYSFQLTSNGSNTAAVKVGDVITVQFTLAADNSYALYAMQDEIMYDSSKLQYVNGSLSMTGGFKSGFRDMEESVYKKVLMNYVSASVDGEVQGASVVIGSFKLQAIASGTTTVSNQDYYCTTKTGANNYKSAASDLTVTISSSSGGGGTGGGGSGGGGVDIGDTEIPTTGETTGGYFDDVLSTHWAYNYVEYLATLGIVHGKSAALFCPEDNITRAEFVTILARMSGDTLPSYSGNFNDVASASYYAQAVSWAVANGITNGTSANIFSPNSNITRQDMAALIYRYAVYKGYSFATVNAAVNFIDQADIASYALTAVSTMQQANIINGYSDNSFKPLGNANRAESAKMLALLYQAMNTNAQ